MKVDELEKITPPEQTDIRGWLVASEPGERPVYWRGLLARDRLVNPALNRLASVILHAAEVRQVALFQQRCGKEYRYFVVRLPRPKMRTAIAA